MPIVWEDTGNGVMRPWARCGHKGCATPPAEMPTSEHYARKIDPATGTARLEPLAVQLPEGWAEWTSQLGEKVLFCPDTITALRAQFVFNTDPAPGS